MNLPPLQTLLPLRLRRIPKQFHFIWDNPVVPMPYLRLRDKWCEMHGPRWSIHQWNFSTGQLVIERYRPKLLRRWFDLPTTVQRADLLRYVLLDVFGGVYLDMDTAPLCRFDSLIHGNDFVIGYENKKHPSLCNAIIASVPGHPIMRGMLRHLEQSPPDRTPPSPHDVSHVFATTGSLALTPIVHALRTSRTELKPVHAFYPFDWSEKKLHASDWPGSWCKHYWSSGWYDGRKYNLDAYWETAAATVPGPGPYGEAQGSWTSSWSSEREAVADESKGKAE